MQQADKTPARPLPATKWILDRRQADKLDTIQVCKESEELLQTRNNSHFALYFKVARIARIFARCTNNLEKRSKLESHGYVTDSVTTKS